MNLAQKNVLVLAPFFVPAFRGGGPIQTLRALVAGASRMVSTSVLTRNHDLGESTPLVVDADQWCKRDGARVWYSSGGARRDLGAYIGALRSLDPSLIYLNSLFDLHYSVIPQLLRLVGIGNGRGFLLAPRGELNEGALKIRRTKKRLFLAFYRATGMHRRTIWHASTEHEAKDIQRVFGKRVQILVRENETILPERAFERVERRVGPCRLIFASRAVPKKGLLTALKALVNVSVPLDFDVVGAFEEPEYESACRAAITALPAHIRVTLHGAMPRADVLDRLERSDAFVFPTAGENFGHVIAEALSKSCPVICSSYTPWSRRLHLGGGSVVETNTATAWATAIEDFVEGGDDAWLEASKNAGLAYVDWRHENKGPHVFDLAFRLLRAADLVDE